MRCSHPDHEIRSRTDSRFDLKFYFELFFEKLSFYTEISYFSFHFSILQNRSHLGGCKMQDARCKTQLELQQVIQNRQVMCSRSSVRLQVVSQ